MSSASREDSAESARRWDVSNLSRRSYSNLRRLHYDQHFTPHYPSPFASSFRGSFARRLARLSPRSPLAARLLNTSSTLSHRRWYNPEMFGVRWEVRPLSRVARLEVRSAALTSWLQLTYVYCCTPSGREILLTKL